MYIAVFIALVFAVYIFRVYFWQIIRTKWYGKETDAVVSRIEAGSVVPAGTIIPGRSTNVTFYVLFQTEDGQQREARLLNPKRQLVKGSLVRIRYPEEMVDYAVVTEIPG